MIQLVRGNAHVEVLGASPSLLSLLARHLAVPVDAAERGSRFGGFFVAQAEEGKKQLWGTLLRENVAAAGLTPHLELLLRHYQQGYELRDVRQRPKDQLPLWSLRHEPRPYQEYARKRLVEHGAGVVDAPPRAGKTRMMAMALDALNLRALIVCPSVAIVRQTYQVLLEIFGEDFVSRVDGEATDAERDPERQFVVAATPSAVKLPKEYFAKLDVLIVDETHHGASDSYHVLNELAANAYYRFCFTGTYFRTGDDRLAMEALCSNVVCKIPVDYLVQGGWLVPPRLVVAVPRAPRVVASWPDCYEQGVVECPQRNAMVAYVARSMIDSNVPVLVLTRRRAHAKALAEAIPGAALVRGGEAALTDESLDAFRSGKIPAIVGTTVVGEGVDLPSAGAVVYASGGGGGVQQVQGYFRPLTGYPGKAQGLIYDFHDTHHSTLRRHSEERVALAEQCLGVQAARLWQ